MTRKLCSLLLCIALLLTAAFAGAEQAITIPDITMKEFEIPDNEALTFVHNMKAGWNLGNTFDANNCTWLRNKLDYETAWVHVRTTKELIEAIQAAGFQTVRIPVSWHDHVDAEFNIDKDWLDRVQEVVDYAYDIGMYVILNSHHDNIKGFYYPTYDELETSKAYMKALWSQLGERFADYDEHLIMESMNEPRLSGTPQEWNWSTTSSHYMEAQDCINQINQLFVDTVRAAGGKNAERYLMVPAYAAKPEAAASVLYVLPQDTADNRLIVSVHAYTPYNFALQQGGISTFDLDGNQKSVIGMFMNTLYNHFVSRGIPVVIGEFGAVDRNNPQDRVNFTAYYTKSARARGMTACWWDNHGFTGSGELFGIIHRDTLIWSAPEIVDAIMKYCE